MVSALANRMFADVANLADRHRSDLTLEERQDYIRAVYCLMEQPSLTQFEAPGAQHRFDDYVVIHLQQTHRNHGSVSLATLPNPYPLKILEDVLIACPFQTFFLPWHRYYVWHYEYSLRTLCGYKGYQPVSTQAFPLLPSLRPPILNTIVAVLELGPLRRRPRQLTPLRW
jgi:Common central domain of tyrosinase.